jgi:2-polyprenyl-3-methyl-5-hydroxy-6-metoxy-1,4-benzoquinol methylase
MAIPSAEYRDLVERLNTQWRVAGPSDGSFGRRLLFRIRSLLGRVLLGPQETFNAAVVEYINATLDGVEQTRFAAEEITRYRESLAARERRMESTMATIVRGQEELRASLAVLQQSTQNLKRELTRVATAPGGPLPPVSVASPSPLDFDSHKYVAFEDQFRGSPEEIRRRLAEYLPLFHGAADILDVGCGRGEFLALLREQGITARGIDLNASMVEVCQRTGLDAYQADALGYLRSQPDASLGGLFAAQVVEHLEPAYLIQFLDAAFDKLRPGSRIVLETINPGCWFAFFESYIRDITHSQPLHPDTLKHLLIASGFQRIDIQYRAPYPEWDKLQPLAADTRDAGLLEQVETLNANVEKINRLLFTYLDYAAVGHRP